MRHLAVGLAVVLISVPALAVAGGPDALSIAKRALAQAKQPPKINQVYTAVSEVTGPETERFRVRCPRGMVAISITSEIPTLYESVHGRRALAVVARQQVWGSGQVSGITVTCLEGRLER